MRISDWSSDVCSSDLPAHDCRFRLFDIVRRVAIVCREYPIPTFPLRHPLDQLHNIPLAVPQCERSEEHTSELQSLMRISYAVFCLKKTHNKHVISNLQK